MWHARASTHTSVNKTCVLNWVHACAWTHMCVYVCMCVSVKARLWMHVYCVHVGPIVAICMCKRSMCVYEYVHMCMYACICDSTCVHVCTSARTSWLQVPSIPGCVGQSCTHWTDACLPDYPSVPAQTLAHSLHPTGPVEDNKQGRRNEGGGEVEYIHIHTAPTESVYNEGRGEVEVEVENAHTMT